MSLSYIIQSILAPTAVNPVKILVLFISMTILSVFLDEIGFFRYVANSTLKKAGKSQLKLFIFLYLIVSVLTVFTSNDIIVLTFTPFICYFAFQAKINPVPYLVTVFVAANTWSMALIIGNPTNIYLATSAQIDFLFYIKNMIFPTVAAGLTSFAILFLLFRKEFSAPIENQTFAPQKTGFISDSALLIAGLLHLAFATIMLAVSSYCGIEMWIVALGSVISLFVCNLIIALIKFRKPSEILTCLKRAPWTLVPFLLFMFILILFLKDWGVPEFLAKILAFKNPKAQVFSFGLSSFLCCNIINNIPMSVLFSSVLENLTGDGRIPAIFSVVIGSNLGAFLTPFGALAGLMWRKILKKQGIVFSVKDFVKYGAAAGIPGILVALGIIQLLCK